ncbi:MAG: TonB-dependent receptor plug domain-containing protein [Alphaproteobacteria bacterium]
MITPAHPARHGFGRLLLATAAAALVPVMLPHAAAARSAPAGPGGIAPAVTLDPIAVQAAGAGSLTVPTPEEAAQRLSRVPGAAAVVPAEDFDRTAAMTTKDTLDYVPGVFAPPKWGEDARFSIRGSGLSRNFPPPRRQAAAGRRADLQGRRQRRFPGESPTPCSACAPAGTSRGAACSSTRAT